MYGSHFMDHAASICAQYEGQPRELYLAVHSPVCMHWLIIDLQSLHRQTWLQLPPEHMLLKCMPSLSRHQCLYSYTAKGT